MALDTYSNLKTEIASYLNRDDLTTNIDTFIDLAESRHAKDLRLREMAVKFYRYYCFRHKIYFFTDRYF